MSKPVEVRVTALRPEGRWRAGRHFAPQPTTVSVLDDELRLLEHDPLLLVEREQPKRKAKPTTGDTD
jgi:hypothetical protein